MSASTQTARGWPAAQRCWHCRPCAASAGTLQARQPTGSPHLSSSPRPPTFTPSCRVPDKRPTLAWTARGTSQSLKVRVTLSQSRNAKRTPLREPCMQQPHLGQGSFGSAPRSPGTCSKAAGSCSAQCNGMKCSIHWQRAQRQWESALGQGRSPANTLPPYSGT